jgi:iron complex transport system substrate-binding protein
MIKYILFYKFINIVACSSIVLLLAQCRPNERSETRYHNTSNHVADSIYAIKKAAHFSVEYYDAYKIVKVFDPWKGADKIFTYLLLQNDAARPDHIKADEVIRIPLDNIVCFSTTHIPLLEYIGEQDKLTGFPNTAYISSRVVRERIDEGMVKDLGSEMDVNVESLIALQPDMVMAFGMGEYTSQFNLIKKAGIPVVFNADYMEKDPLGRAEWIKFMALFFNKESVADSIFNAIETRYDSLKNLVAAVEHAPTVFSGIIYGDTWFMPGGKNYAAKFFEDAGAKYLWDDNTEDGYLKLSFENVYEKANGADYWIGVGSFASFDEMGRTDKRYGVFNAFKNRQIFNYNYKIGPAGGSEYFELGYLRPDLILGDLIKIFHPDKLPNYQMYFHQKLK